VIKNCLLITTKNT